jgi:hypothetical protein
MAAALAVGRFGTADQRGAVRQLLADAEPRVRLRAAQGLLAAGDKQAAAALLALLTDAPFPIACQAEEWLVRLAGDQPPAALLGKEAEARRRCRAAWEDWWHQHADRLVLADCDLELRSSLSAAQARRTAQQFLQALINGDTAAFRRTTMAPFVLSSSHTFATRQELDEYFARTFAGDRSSRDYTVAVLTTGNLAAYLQEAPEESVRTFLARHRKPGTQVVYVQLHRKDRGGDEENYAILVAPVRGQPRVIGVGEVARR